MQDANLQSKLMSCLVAAQGHRDLGETDHAAVPELLLIRHSIPQQAYGRHALRRGSHAGGDGASGTWRLQDTGTVPQVQVTKQKPTE